MSRFFIDRRAGDPMNPFRILSGLPPYGPQAITFPSGWGHGANEGLVVEFDFPAQSPWVGNFARGLGGINEVRPYPDCRTILVIAQNEIYFVDPLTRTATHLNLPITEIWAVPGVPDLILSRQDIALLRIGPAGIMWHTRRVSWDGFRNIQISAEKITGEAWCPGESWLPFAVDPRTGRTDGGSYTGPEEKGWEQLASKST